MKYLFHLNTFNDIDHIAPVIWKILENGGYVDVIFLSEFDFKSDYRIIFLLEYDRFNVCKAGKYQQLRNKILFRLLKAPKIKKASIHNNIGPNRCK